MGYIGMCGAKEYGFSAALVINRVSVLAICRHFGNKQGIDFFTLFFFFFFLRRNYFFIIVFTVTVYVLQQLVTRSGHALDSRGF